MMSSETNMSSYQVCDRHDDQLHVVIAPFSCYGHILPAISFTRILASRGFFVSFVLSQHRISGPRSVATHLNSLQSSFPSSFRLLSIPDPFASHALGLGVDEGDESVAVEIERCSNLMRQPFRCLMNDMIMADVGSTPGAPVCVISDAWLSWIPDITDELQIPWYVFYPSPPLILTTLFFLPALQAQGRIPLKAASAPQDDEQLIVRVPNMPPLHNLECHSLLLDNHKFPSIQEKFLGNWMKIPHRAAGLLINTFYELDPVSIDALQQPELNPKCIDILTVGPVHLFSAASQGPSPSKAEANGNSDSSSEKEKQCLQWLDAQPPASVLYVSFGTLALPSLPQIHELALGLEASEQSFLWTLRPPLGSHSQSQAEFDASTILPEGFLSRVEKRGLILVGWAPQQLILSHPSTGAFLTHCGWNSTLESICMGVPMIGCPHFADQPTNCKFVKEIAKVGIELHRSGAAADGVVERREVERAARLMLTGKEGMELRRKAKELSAIAAKVGDKGGSSDGNLELFINKMEKLHSSKFKGSNHAGLGY